jgi:hypothetical protein
MLPANTALGPTSRSFNGIKFEKIFRSFYFIYLIFFSRFLYSYPDDARGAWANLVHMYADTLECLSDVKSHREICFGFREYEFHRVESRK